LQFISDEINLCGNTVRVSYSHLYDLNRIGAYTINGRDYRDWPTELLAVCLGLKTTKPPHLRFPIDNVTMLTGPKLPVTAM